MAGTDYKNNDTNIEKNINEPIEELADRLFDQNKFTVSEEILALFGELKVSKNYFFLPKLLKRLGEDNALALLTAVEEKQAVFRIFGIWDQMKEALIKKDISELDKLLTQFNSLIPKIYAEGDKIKPR